MGYHIFRHILFAVAMLSTAWPCRGAAEPDSAATLLDNVTVSARRMPVKVSADMPVQFLTSATISSLGIQDMADAVRRFAGTTVRDYGGIGGLKTVSVRNMGAAHTGVSYDGVPVSNCQGGQIDIGRFSLDNVSTVSMAVGTTDNLLQPASLYASGAVLGIATETPAFADNRRKSFRLGMKGGSFGFVSPSARWWWQPSGRSTVALEGDYLRADGNYPFTLTNGKVVTRERRNNSAIDSWHAEANLSYDFSAASSLRVKAYHYHSHRGLPGAVTLYNPVSTETLRDRNTFVQAVWQGRLSPRWRMQAVAKYSYGWNRDRELNPQFTGGVYQDTHRQDEYYLSASAEYSPSAALTAALATDAITNTLESTLAACPFPRRFTSLSSAAARLKLGPLTANASLLATYATEHVRTGPAPDDIFRLNPSLAFNIKPWTDRQLYLRAMFKTTFRMPSFNDLYYERSGNRNLRPEKAAEYNLGITWNISLPAPASYLAFTLDGYYNDITDKIVAFPTTYVWKTVNYGKVHASGIDITAAASLSLPLDAELTITGAYSWQRAINLSDPHAGDYHGQLPYTPRHSGNAAATVSTRWIRIGYSAVAVGKRYFMSQNIPANEIKAYVEQTLTAGREFSFGPATLDLRAELVNLGNVSYEVIRFYPMPGRSWRLVASCKF